MTRTCDSMQYQLLKWGFFIPFYCSSCLSVILYSEEFFLGLFPSNLKQHLICIFCCMIHRRQHSAMYVINNNVIPPNVSKPPGARLFRSHPFFCLTIIFCVLIDAIQCDISVLFLPSSIIEIVQCKVMQLPPDKSVFM